MTIEHYVCSLLLIIASGLIGRLWPRKTVETPVEAPVEPKIEPPPQYGLFIPPECKEIDLSGLNYVHTYVHGNYKSVTLKSEDKIKVTFRGDSKYIDNKVTGVFAK